MSDTPHRGTSHEAAGNPGLFAALRTLATTFVATARTRLELAGNDLEFERLRLVRTLVLAVAALFCLGLGLVLLAGLAVALYWENRVGILAALGGGFTAAGIALIVAAQRANARRQAFAATIAELEEDLRQLRAATGHGQPRD